MVKRENSYAESMKFVKSLKEAESQKEINAVQEKVNKIEAWKKEYNKIITDRVKRERFHSRLLEAARNDALSSAIKAIYITALENYCGLSDDETALAESIVENWVTESGGTEVILSTKNQHRTYLLAKLAEITENAARRAVMEVESISEADDDDEDEDKKEETKEEVKVEDDVEETDDKDDEDDASDDSDDDEEGDTKEEEEVEDDVEVEEPEEGDFPDEDLDKDTDNDDEEDEEESEDDEDYSDELEIDFEDDENNDDEAIDYDEVEDDESEEDSDSDDSSSDSDINADDSDVEDTDEPDIEAGDDSDITDGEEEISDSDDEEVSDEEQDKAGEEILDDDPNEDEDDSDVDSTEDPDTTDEEDYDDSIDSDEIYKDLEDEEDVKKAIDTIQTRVADAEEKFIKKNAEDKKKVDELLHKINNSVKTVEEIDDDENPKSQAEQEHALLYKRQINDLANRAPKSVFEAMANEISKATYIAESAKANITDRATEAVDTSMDAIIGKTRILYGFLETLNTLKLEDVNEAYIKKVINEIN